MSVSLKQSYDIEYDGTANVARMDLFVDTADDLTGLTTFDSITLLQGSTAEDISTGDKYMMQTNGTWVKQPSANVFSNVYTKAEIDSMFYLYYTKTEADALFEWVTVTITTDTLPLSFISGGSPLTEWSISGNGQQTGTPTPDNPIQPDFVGTLDNSDWTIPITCAGQTVPVYLGEVPTVRRIRKLVLTGEESIENASNGIKRFIISGYLRQTGNVPFCTHYVGQDVVGGTSEVGELCIAFLVSSSGNNFMYVCDNSYTVDTFKSYLADEYSAGHPVTVWYVIAEPQTGITNEPLAKIGDYCDELHSSDAGVTIPTAKGANTLTVGGDLQPSEMTITGKIREVTENEQ